jgi:hypothetical protein
VYKKAEPLYGAPRGNRVMAAKRTTGPSAKRVLDLHLKLEKCSVSGCLDPVFATRTISGTQKVRMCVTHLADPKPIHADKWWETYRLTYHD